MSKDGENYPVTDGKFTPDREGEYTVTYTAVYRGRTYSAETTVSIDGYRLSVSSLADGTSGQSYTIEGAALLSWDGKAVTSGVSWSYSVTLDGSAYATGKTFTPDRAGVYTVYITASYEGKSYSGTAVLTVSRAAPAKEEVESFDDASSLDSVSVTDVTSLRWSETDGVVATIAQSEGGNYPSFTLRARQQKAYYEDLLAEGYNAVTLELCLMPVTRAGNAVVKMQYWPDAGEKASQGSVAVGKWVTLTFDLQTFIDAMGADGSVKFFWVESAGEMRILEMSVRNVNVVKAADVLCFADGVEGAFLLNSPENPASNAYFEADSSEIPSGVPEAVKGNGAVRLSLSAGRESWPHIMFSADRNMFDGGNTVTVTMYVKSSSSSPLSIRQWPHGGDWIVKGELPVNQWVEFKMDAEVLRSVYNWGVANGIAYTDLLWFTNAGGNTVSEVWIAGLRVSDEAPVSFAESGISMENTTGETFEDGETQLNAWFGILSKQGHAYKLSIKYGETILEKGKDYTVSDQDASVTLIDPEAGEYTFVFESYGERFTSGSITVTVTEKSYQVVIPTLDDGKTDEDYALPDATLQGASEGVPVEWSCSVSKDGENYPVTDGKFTPDAEGEYTVTYTAVYRGRTYTAEASLTVKKAVYSVEVPDLKNGTSGIEYTLGEAKLSDGLGSYVEGSGVVWSYSVAFSDQELYNSLYGAITVSGGVFTPMIAGEYTVTYTADFDGGTYSQTATLTVVRAAAEANEIESFDDYTSLDSVRLGEGNGAYAEEYLKKGDSRLPDGAQGGVSFTVPAGAESWPDLYITSRISSLDGYDSVVIPVFIAAQGDRVELRQKNADNSDKIFYFAANTWVNFVLNAEEYKSYLEGTTRICFVQNVSSIAVTEVRIASVYARVNDPSIVDMSTTTSFPEGNLWTDAGLSKDNDTFKNYYDKSLAPDGMPLGMDRAFRFYFNGTSNDGSMELWTTATQQQMIDWLDEGYKKVDVSFYFGVSDASETFQVTVFSGNSDEKYDVQLSVNEWVTISLDLETFKECVWENNGQWQIKLFYLYGGTSAVTDIWMTGFKLSK